MKNYFPILCSAHLFSGISEYEIDSILTCLAPKKADFPKDAFLLRAGETTDSIGLVLAGSVLIIQEDIWGNRNILSKAVPGQTFATAYACASGFALNVDVAAETPTTVLFLSVKRILNVCPSACTHHNRIIRNLIDELAEKNLNLGKKLTDISQRTTQAKLMSYLSAEAHRCGKCEFDIPFSRQQLADYLAVDRCGMSRELTKMKRNGLLDFRKNHFVLYTE